MSKEHQQCDNDCISFTKHNLLVIFCEKNIAKIYKKKANFFREKSIEKKKVKFVYKHLIFFKIKLK